MILIDSKQVTLPTVLGTANTEYVINNAILMQIFIKPATASTTYDFTLTDINSNVILQESNCYGEFNQLLAVPSYGNITLTLSNALRDENFTCILIFRRS